MIRKYKILSLQYWNTKLLHAPVYFFISAVFFCSASILAAQERPNIILILADDLGVGDLGVAGSPIATPNLDQMAGEGVQLTNFYASANVCTPSRAGLLTGRYSIRMGLAYKTIEVSSVNGLPESEQTLAELLKQGGYDTTLIGKWHLGHTPEHRPTRHGFDSFFGVLYSNDMHPFSLYRNDEILAESIDQSTLTRRYTEEVIEYIDHQREHPFFIYLAHTFPHYPLFASEAFQGRSKAGLYGDAVEELDWSVGEILKVLKRNNIQDNTLIIFTSDNGAWFEGSNATSRNGKGHSWDGGYRVPMIAWWPTRISPGTTSSGLSMNTDVLPTIAHRTGLVPEGSTQLDGRNIWPLLQGEAINEERVLYLFNDEDIAAIRTEKYKYIVRGYYRNNYVAFDRFESGFGYAYPLLFDMTVENPERYSVASNHPQIVNDMDRLLTEARSEFELLRTVSAMPAFPGKPEGN
jgi:uncharacterized sulfatase